MQIDIKCRFTGRMLFSHTAEGNTIKATVEAAVSARANLAGAYLADANLADAYLADANLAGAYLARAYLAGAYLARANLADAYLADANLARANLARAYLAGAYLARANLADAYLADANLARANLAGAYLAGAKWRDDIVIQRAPLQLYGLPYPVTILDAHMQIGCELHTIAEWAAFDDARIVQMDNKTALTFWRAHKTALLALAASDGRGAKPVETVEQEAA
jgi:hypothetical protein